MKYSITLFSEQLHELLRERDAFHADLEAVVETLRLVRVWVKDKDTQRVMDKTLALPGVQAVLPKK